MRPPPLRNPQWQRRCAAFVIDSTVLAALALLLAMPWWRSDLRDADSVLDALRAAMNDAMTNALGSDAGTGSMYARLFADPALHASMMLFVHRVTDAILVVALAYAVLSALWNLGGELSGWQGSPGKHLLGLRVVDASGRRAVFPQLFLRQLAAGLSWLTLNLGHLMAWLPPFRSLHDRIAGTDVVVAPDVGPLPAWARVLLHLATLAAIVLPLLAVAWLAMRLSTP